MNNDHFDAEVTYQISVSIAENLLKAGLLTDTEFSHAKALLLETYHPLLGSLFAQTP